LRGIEVCCLLGEYVAAEVGIRLAGLDERQKKVLDIDP